MKRLTYRCNDGQAVMDCVNCEFDGAEKCTSLRCRNMTRDRLAGYEDIELLPSEIETQLGNYSAFLSEMTGGLLSKTNYTVEAMVSCADDYRERECSVCSDRTDAVKYRAAEEQGRLVVLPFAVDTEVWSAEPFKDGKSRRGKVTVFEADEDGAYAFWASFSPVPLSAEFLLADMGKTVFLTREEAEKTLEGL